MNGCLDTSYGFPIETCSPYHVVLKNVLNSLSNFSSKDWKVVMYLCWVWQRPVPCRLSSWLPSSLNHSAPSQITIVSATIHHTVQLKNHSIIHMSVSDYSITVSGQSDRICRVVQKVTVPDIYIQLIWIHLSLNNYRTDYTLYSWLMSVTMIATSLTASLNNH